MRLRMLSHHASKFGTITKYCSRIPWRQNLKRKFSWSKRNPIYHISEEVKDALHLKLPVVALESTIITHGMPYPENVNTAVEVEKLVRHSNSIPATIGVISGRIHVGLSHHEMELLGKKQSDVMKIGRRDLPYAISQHWNGGTTVSATAMIARKMNIKIFVTGGIGGVHQGATNSMDISSDLIELARNPITIVSAGVKSILDIGRTLEYLETHGVTVVSYGSKREFPAFFTPESGFLTPCNVIDASAAARLIASRDSLDIESGILIAVPIPYEYHKEGHTIEEAIQKAVAEAERKNITGKDVTPFILSALNELTAGSSLQCNIALIKNNAFIGGQIASELHKIQSSSSSDNQPFSAMDKTTKSLQQETSQTSSRPVVIGGSILDFVTTVLHDRILLDGRGHSGSIRSSAGGVGRNIADCLSKLGHNPLLLSAVGDDHNGEIVLKHNPKMDISGIKILHGVPTAIYSSILNNKGEFLFGIQDMDSHKFIDVEHILRHEKYITSAPLVIIDANISENLLSTVLEICRRHGIPVWFEPTDVSQAKKPFYSEHWKSITYSSPNYNELRMMYSAATGESLNTIPIEDIGRMDTQELRKSCVELSRPLLEYIPNLIVTLGARGALLITTYPEDRKFPTSKVQHTKENMRIFYAPTEECSCTVSVSGAGDCFTGAMVSAILRGCNQNKCVRAGIQAAAESLKSYHAVPDSIERLEL